MPLHAPPGLLDRPGADSCRRVGRQLCSLVGIVGVVPTYRIGRLIMVGDPVTGTAAEAGQTVVYERVSSADQKADLDRQVARVSVWVTGQKLGVDRVVTEVDDDLVCDVIEILTSLCARLSGRRAAANRARRVVEAATGARV